MNNIISIAADFSNDKCYPTAYVVKGDTGDVFNISIHKDGANADLSDITLALITFRQGEFSASQEGTIKGSTVSFTLNPACVRIGANLGEVALYHNDTLVTTALFCVAVRSSLQDEGTTIPEDESPTLIEFIEKYSGGSGGNVLSVNGKTGDVVLSANDVGADTAGTASVLVNAKPGEKCEGKIFNIPTGETDADGNAIYEEKTAGIGTERFNVYENASFEWNGITRTFTPCKPIGKFISARGTGNISRGLLEDVCGADNKTGEKDIGTRQSGCANYAESYFGSQDGCGGTLTGKYGRTSGAYNVARGYACEARGRYTIADGSHGNVSGRPQETFGQFNIPDNTQKYMAIGGNGTDNEHRSNAYMLDYDGNAYFSGNVKIGGTPTDDNDAVTKAYVDAHSGSNKQGDWNQNDTMAADYIKNRPGAYMGDETIYDGTPTTALASGSYRVMLSPAFTLTAGNAYRVTFNGTAYVLTAQDKTAEVNAIILGELTSDNKLDFTNYPFCIYQQMGQLAALYTETAGTYTLKVESLGTVVVPLDSKFMPLGYATEAFVTNAIAGYATEEFVTNAINAALYVDSETEVG